MKSKVAIGPDVTAGRAEGGTVGRGAEKLGRRVEPIGIVQRLDDRPQVIGWEMVAREGIDVRGR
jgi:hypothetical protein